VLREPGATTANRTPDRAHSSTSVHANEVGDSGSVIAPQFPVPNVVLIPGFTQTAASWASVREVVDASCDVLAVEVPVRDTFESTARSIGVRGQRAIYVGYSMVVGWPCGWRSTIRNLVQGLVLVSMSPVSPTLSARRTRGLRREARAPSRARGHRGVPGVVARAAAVR